MSSRPFNKVLHLKRKRSTALLVIIVLMHVLALLSVAVVFSVASIEWWLLVLPIVASGIYSAKLHLFLTMPKSVKNITQSTDGDWSLQLVNGEIIGAELCDDSYKHPLLVVLNFKTQYGRISVPLLFDAIDRDLHRRLRSRLTLSRPAEKEKLLRR